MPRPRVLILRAPGTNCDEETADAWEQAGALVEARHIAALADAPTALDSFQILTIPGGFSFGDDLGAGRVLASRLGALFGDLLPRFRDRGGLILGICNGFQVLVRAGLLPGPASSAGAGEDENEGATLTFNDSGHFESRWVRLVPTPGLCPFVRDAEPLELPVAHGEGKFLTARPETLARLEGAGQVVLRYADAAGRPAEDYPSNPNGSPGAVAGVCDATGRVFGLMPHPERHVSPLHHPRWTRRGVTPDCPGDGLKIFRNAVTTWVD